MNQRYLNRRMKSVILDDDPTGTQTVAGVYIYTSFDETTLRQALLDEYEACFILTNSRGLKKPETIALHHQIGAHLKKLAVELDLQIQIISRSDSTLRQHYPIETEALHEEEPYQGEIFIPALIEGGRVTIDDVHYQQQQGQLIRCDQLDYASDQSFPYRSSELKEWIEEKTEGRFKASETKSIPLAWLRTEDIPKIQQTLRELQQFQKVVVNAETLEDLEVFTQALRPILREHRLMIRCAASFVGVYLRSTGRPLLSANQMVDAQAATGGLVVIGSHVAKTTQQLQALMHQSLPLTMIEFNQHRVLDGQLQEEAQSVREAVQSALNRRETVIIATRRDRLDLPEASEDQQLALTQEIAYALMSVVRDLQVKPAYLIAKGGITSSDIATKSLETKRALVLGQALPCIPVWKIIEGKYQGMSYIVFPGNIGQDNDLSQLVETLEKERLS